MIEKTMEDILARYPGLIEPGLLLVGRQSVVHGRRMDLVFKDALGRDLITEPKAGPIKDEHIGQIMAYEGSMLSHRNPDLRIMLMGTRVPPNIRRSLDHHGIAWKEITEDMLLAHLRSANDQELLEAMEPDAGFDRVKEARPSVATPAAGLSGTRAVLATMFASQAEVTAFREVLERLGKVIYPVKAGISEETANWASQLFLYAQGTNEVRFRADILSVVRKRPTGNEPELPTCFRPYLDRYKSYLVLGTFETIAPIHWRDLLDKEGIPIRAVPQSSMMRVQTKVQPDVSGRSQACAFFAPVHREWVEQAMCELSGGAPKRYFRTNSVTASIANQWPIKSVYFKLTGENAVSAKAEFLELTDVNPSEFRLQGSENDLGKYYYGFRNLRWLKAPHPVGKLLHYPSGVAMRNDAPGACMITDPEIE